MPVRSVWFPTPAELRRWEESGLPLYVRRVGAATVEVGPRLGSMWASCFAPVDVLRFDTDGKVAVSRRLPRFTVGILAVWWVATIGWGASELPKVAAGDLHPAFLVFFAVLALASTVGPWVGWRQGSTWLDGHRRWWVEALEGQADGEDW